MAKKTKASNNWLQTTAVRVSRIHFIYILAFLLSIVVFDTWNLYTHEAVSQLWTAGGILLIFNVLIWFVSRLKLSNYWYYIGFMLALIVADIIFASYIVWWQRGLYSKAIMLYTVPIITAATMRSRSILLAVTTLSVAAYSITSVRFFFKNYGLGYRVELWGTVGFYSAILFVLALLLMVVIRPTEEKFN
ncbi:hypothetical protein KW803_03245 [Candidatus Saccharibacteria bacterium]|nr:hypothetical protein [Candidatus Saccharibacteria bacterium]